MNIGTAREISSDKLRPRSLAPLVKTRGFGMTPCSAPYFVLQSTL